MILPRFAVLAICLGFSLLLARIVPAADLSLWYEKPANNAMNETLPIGNGRMGGLIFGTVAKERIIVNEDSLWTGGENPGGEYNDNFGAYQVLGEVQINLPGHEERNYRRDLDLTTALSHTRYESGGVTYSREYFVSQPDQVLVVRMTASQPGSYTGSIELSDSHNGKTAVSGNKLSVAGALKNDLKYDWQLVAKNDRGTLTAKDGKLDFEKCDSLTLIVGTGTDYAMNYAKKFRGEAPEPKISRQVQLASAKPYETLKAAHLNDFQPFFNRVSLELGKSTPEQIAMPTDKRKIAAATTVDPELEQILFQYGRYLLISSSRPGSLPANLQGLWNDRNDPDWHCDYHANINLQMNYWPAEPANLAEFHLPLFDFIRGQLDPWRKATSLSGDYKLASGEMSKRGFALRTSLNIFGGMGWDWDKSANAWLCLHFWEHYAFSQDKVFLKNVAYPVMKETTQFWEDHLKQMPDGRLVVPDGWSPEHGPHEDGVSYNQQIVWDLFNNYVEAADALAIDKPYREKIAAMRDKLIGPTVGKWGQLQEWMDDKDDQNDHHRHTSNLFAVFPGRQVSVAKTPELAAAAKVSLDARGISADSDVREWSLAWRTALYARLHDGEKAHGMVQNLFTERNTCPNLFGLHPPMQMDGNFGITAGIAEMLVQSHEGEINLLPALPAAWPNGFVKGLRARGGFIVDVAWKDGKLAGAIIHSSVGTNPKVRSGNKLATAALKPGGVVKLGPDL